jgi:hypothetical protein
MAGEESSNGRNTLAKEKWHRGRAKRRQWKRRIDPWEAVVGRDSKKIGEGAWHKAEECANKRGSVNIGELKIN